ncbi:hypothetical protein E4T49_07404 [Aureobasidium sp. EXF-10728]|nr:hypothetical protein E4T49_07404 [Aureobasidium sp. EXF-10728]
MASLLPQEIISLIAHHTAKQNKKLTPYTLVNKSWQPAFEKQIYSSVVLLSPSEITTVTVSPNQRVQKRGLSLARLDEITSGWRTVRRKWIRRIGYRVAVPYWLDPGREKDDDFTYDNICRRENNEAFSRGVRSLFEYLSGWTGQDISLDIALQAELAYVDDEHYEPDGLQEEIEPYCADLVPGWHLPDANCVTSLDFPETKLPSYDTENKILPPAALKIAMACTSLQNIRLDGRCGIPCIDSNVLTRTQVRDATAAGLSQLPPSVQSIELLGDVPSEYDCSDVRPASATFRIQDPLCIALHKISRQLKSLCIDNEVVFCELFRTDETDNILDGHWPYLEILRLENIDDGSPVSAIARYADGSTDDDALFERYIDDLYTSFGYAAQKIPRLRDASLQFCNGQGLDFYRHDCGQWKLTFTVRNIDTYKPSSRVLKAWKVPGLALQPCASAPYYHEAVYTSWPPL